jgi:predicted negative regulator of RcsB-dependent stress response
MDDRLKQVQTTDLTDSRLNHEFVAWLKTSGMNYLLMLLLVACGFLAWDWWNRKQGEAIDTAWTELASATSPAALRGVAETHATVDGVAELSLLTAGDILLQSARSGLRPGLAAGDEGAELTPEDKASTLQEADAFFAEAVQLASARPEFAGKPMMIAGLFGRAAVAESAGRLDEARTHLEKVVEISKPEYPPLAEQATARLANLDGIGAHASLPNQADLPVIAVSEEEAFTVPAADDLLEMFEAEDDEPVESTPETGDDASPEAAGSTAETETTETPAAP